MAAEGHTCVIYDRFMHRCRHHGVALTRLAKVHGHIELRQHVGYILDVGRARGAGRMKRDIDEG
jgi:hypothetical protein